MNVPPALISFMFCCSVIFYFFNLNFFFQKAGTSADYSMDLHHKEQLHDNVSMMQAQHYSVSFNFCCGERKNENKHRKLISLHRFDQGIGLVQNSLMDLPFMLFFGALNCLTSQIRCLIWTKICFLCN